MEQSISTVYCHFSFKRPKGKDFGYFAVALYKDFDGKNLMAQITRKYLLWENHQFITAIQAYEHALYSIYKWQAVLKSRGINEVMLVTDNSTIAGWILNPRKNKEYTKWMNKAVEPYRAGAPKEIVIGVGLCEVREYEKSYKYCNESKVIYDETSIKVQKGNDGKNVIKISESQYKTIEQMEESNINKPIIVDMQ